MTTIISAILRMSRDELETETVRSDGDGRVIQECEEQLTAGKSAPLSVVPTIVAVAITATPRLMDECAWPTE
jgi:hypothetical protein